MSTHGPDNVHRWRSVNSMGEEKQSNVYHFLLRSNLFEFYFLGLLRDPVTNTSGLTLEQLSAFKKLEEITGTEHRERCLLLFFCKYCSCKTSNLCSFPF